MAGINKHKIIFLDFDGVLNSTHYFENRHFRPDIDVNNTLDPKAGQLLQELLDVDPAIKLVISSAWRIRNSLDTLKMYLNEVGIDTSKVIGVTPVLNSNERGDDVQAWLDIHQDQVETFVILDDDSDMAHLKDKLVQTDSAIGLTLNDIEKIREMLK